MLAVLAAIFVVTAYVAVPTPTRREPGPVGRCLVPRPGLDVVQDCGLDRTERRVVALPPCPAGTEAHQLLGRAQVVCLDEG
jgi:hypothetical protein